MTPFFEYIPKNIKKNLQWRVRVREAALHDKEVQRTIYDGCMEDVLLFFNLFGWCFEPRGKDKIRPFVTWPHQDPVIVAMDQAITDSEANEEPIDVLVNKSRGQGATWMYILVFLRRWLRDPLFSCGLVTRNEALVDSLRDPDTLIWKFDWALRRLPYWMLPVGYDFNKHRSLSDHTVTNPENGSTLIGYAANKDVGRGGRKTAYAIDELGAKDFISGGKDYDVLDSTQHVTNCRIIPSTFGGDVGAFYEMVNDPGNARLLVLDWKDNPTQNRGAYVQRQGILIPSNPYEGPEVTRYAKEAASTLKKLERRGYQVEGRFRSPWYDSQCLRPGATPRSIAKELDRDPRGAVGKVFDVEVLDRMKEECCKPHLWQGKLIYDTETMELKGLISQENGPLKLWFRPGIDNSPPQAEYCTGHDISAGGTGDYSSNSTICAIDRRTGEQVAEFAVMGMQAIKFARLAVAMAKWFFNAFMAWEASGPTGITFGKTVLEEIGYSNVYYRDVEEVGNRAKSRKAGWWNGSDEDKGELFETLSIGMEEGKFIPRSEELIRECSEYEWDNGKIVHRPSQVKKTAGRAHGDRCIGAGVAWLGFLDRPLDAFDSNPEYEHNPPYGSLAWLHRREERQKADWSDERPQPCLADVIA